MTTIEARVPTQAKHLTASTAGKTGKAGSKAKGPSTQPAANKAETSEAFPRAARHEARSHSDAAEPTRRRDHPGNDAGDGLAATQRAWLPGGDREEEAWLRAHLVEDGGRTAPLSHRDQARSLT